MIEGFDVVFEKTIQLLSKKIYRPNTRSTFQFLFQTAIDCFQMYGSNRTKRSRLKIFGIQFWKQRNEKNLFHLFITLFRRTNTRLANQIFYPKWGKNERLSLLALTHKFQHKHLTCKFLSDSSKLDW